MPKGSSGDNTQELSRSSAKSIYNPPNHHQLRFYPGGNTLRYCQLSVQARPVTAADIGTQVQAVGSDHIYRAGTHPDSDGIQKNGDKADSRLPSKVR